MLLNKENLEICYYCGISFMQNWIYCSVCVCVCVRVYENMNKDRNVNSTYLLFDRYGVFTFLFYLLYCLNFLYYAFITGAT